MAVDTLPSRKSWYNSPKMLGKSFCKILTWPGISDFLKHWELPLSWKFILKEGGRESPAPPLMQLESETERNGFISTNCLVDLKTTHSYFLLGMYSNFGRWCFKITIDKIEKFWIHCQRSLYEAHVGKSRQAGKDRGRGGAADDCPSDVAAGRRRMALETVNRAGLNFVHFLASAITSRTKYCWVLLIGRQRCFYFKFGFWHCRLVEEMTLDVSDGPAYSGLVSWSERRLDLCLKRPSFNCLIHFYKRCVSSLAQMGRSPWVRSGWVSVLSVTTFFIQG